MAVDAAFERRKALPVNGLKYRSGLAARLSATRDREALAEPCGDGRLRRFTLR